MSTAPRSTASHVQAPAPSCLSARFCGSSAVVPFVAEKVSPLRQGSSPVPTGSVIHAEPKEFLWCLPDTVMAAAYLGLLRLRRLLRLTREKRSHHLSSSPQRKGLRDSSWTVVKRTRFSPPHLSPRLLLPRAFRPFEGHQTSGFSRPQAMSKLASIILELTRRSWIISTTRASRVRKPAVWVSGFDQRERILTSSADIAAKGVVLGNLDCATYSLRFG